MRIDPATAQAIFAGILVLFIIRQIYIMAQQKQIMNDQKNISADQTEIMKELKNISANQTRISEQALIWGAFIDILNKISEENSEWKVEISKKMDRLWELLNNPPPHLTNEQIQQKIKFIYESALASKESSDNVHEILNHALEEAQTQLKKSEEEWQIYFSDNDTNNKAS